jgi:hypothetical protein
MIIRLNKPTIKIGEFIALLKAPSFFGGIAKNIIIGSEFLLKNEPTAKLPSILWI